MKKSELIASMLEKNPSLDANETAKAVEKVFDLISVTLGDNGRVEIRGFGTFSVIGKPERMGRNPRTGEPVKIAAKNVVHFKSGKELKEVVNK